MARIDDEGTLSRILMMHVSGAVAVLDREMRYLQVSERWLQDWGWREQDLLGRSHFQLFPELEKHWPEQVERPVFRGERRSGEDTFVQSDGCSARVRWQADPWRTADGEIRGMVLCTEPMPSRDSSRQPPILPTEACLRRIIESPMLGFAFGIPQGLIHEANDEYLRIVGRTREDLAAGRVDYRQLTLPEYQPAHDDAVRQLMTSGSTKPYEVELERADGTRVPVLLGVSALDAKAEQGVAFVLDLTERRALERQLQQAQRLEAVGRLAAGVAHDLNNVLSAIVLSGEVLSTRISASHPASEHAAEILKSADRAAELTRQLLAFSRQQVLRPRVIDLNALIADLDGMLTRLLGANVDLVFRYAPNVGAVRADPGQLQQVIVNLALNARDAMPDGGTLSIETSECEKDVPFTLGDAHLPGGAYVVVSVSDSGCGMDPTTQARMFEPFFTTKQQGKGTGLGLAMVYGIVRQSGGGIEVRSASGLGTRIAIYLPRVEAPVESIPPKSLPPAATLGQEVVLLVEDDASVRRVTKHVLVGLGYHVLEAGDGEAARALAAAYPATIHVLLTDLIMPGMSGRTLADELVRVRPNLRVLLMSGYTADTQVHRGSIPAGYGYLQKPFTTTELSQRVRALLDTRPS